MIEPRDFYGRSHAPDDDARERMWDRIRGSLGGRYSHPRMSFERRSFFTGVAAGIVLMFTAIGIDTTVRSVIENSQPAAIQVDRAYRTAIGELEEAARRVQGTAAPAENRSDLAAARKEQLLILDGAIEAIRSEASARDISPMLRSRLRELYGKKLALLQTMVEQGEVDL